MPEDTVVSDSVPIPVAYDVAVQGAVDTSEVEEVNGTIPSAEEVGEPAPVQTQSAEEQVPESAAEQPSEAGCWASETTETEPVDAESGKFEPHEETLVEETTVGSWVSQTKEAEPVEVESLPVEEEPSHVAVGNARMAVDEDMPIMSKVTLTRISTGDETPIGRKEPVVREIPVADKTPASEEADPVEDLSATMVRADSVMSVDPLSQAAKSKRSKKKGRRASQVGG
jgi:hypothetical protein